MVSCNAPTQVSLRLWRGVSAMSSECEWDC